MIRFNQKGEFNVPFCRKPQRFAKAYTTKIVNQVHHIEKILQKKQFVFKCQPFEQTFLECNANDIIYCDPPYIDRHTDYYNGWSSNDEKMLFDKLLNTAGKFVLSTWHHNKYRQNDYIDFLWNEFNVVTKTHFFLPRW